MTRRAPRLEVADIMPSPLADDAFVHRILTAASAAPSIHNTQPWRFRLAGTDVVEVHADLDRMLWVADPLGRALHLSCGAALFNLRMAIRSAGYRALVWPLPDPDGAPTLIASVQVAAGAEATLEEAELCTAIGQRHTSRLPFSDRRVPEAIQVSLEQSAGFECTLLHLLTPGEAEFALGLAATSDRYLAANRRHQAELADWVGQPAETGVGIPAAAIGPGHVPPQSPVRDFSAARPGRAAQDGPAVGDPAGRAAEFELQPVLGVLSTVRDGRADWLRAGQGMQRVLLTATRHGLSTSLLYQPVELHDMTGELGWWPWPEQPQMIIRFGYGPAAAATPRLSLAGLLDIA